MNARIARAVVAAGALALASGCALLEPATPAPEAAVPADWPAQAGTAGADATTLGWRGFLRDERLATLVGQALAGNRELRATVLDVERARALYRVRRADRLPALDATGTLTRSGGDVPVTDQYAAGLAVTAFELDLLGRVRNQSAAAARRYLASSEAMRAAHIALVAEVASAWLALAADLEAARIAEATLANQHAVLRLAEQRFALGASSALEVSQARAALESARAEAARYAGQAERDANALRLLVGGPLDPALLPEAFEPAASGLELPPVGLPSEVLLRRPDVRAAELELRAASADIGAARAAFFPSITLTGSAGSASTELSGLFEAGSDTWTFVPRVTLPVFAAGRLRAGLDAANAARDAALARYERSIQAAFREVADALALARSLAAARVAREALVAAATRAEELAEARYRAGQDSYLVLLDAQRTRYAARQALVATQAAEQANLAQLYKALGGGWREAGP